MHTTSQAQVRSAQIPASMSTWALPRPSPTQSRPVHSRDYGTRIVVKRGETIFAEGDDATDLYRLVTGSVRLCRISEEGERQICDFFLPGDLLGITNVETHTFSAEAIEDCSLIKYSRGSIAALMKQDPALAYELQQLTATGLHGAYEHMVRLCRRSARDRIVWFLLAMAKRSVNDNFLNLPMSRVDIADYLGMAHETVSRVFTQLKKSGEIEEVSLNQIKLLNLKSAA